MALKVVYFVLLVLAIVTVMGAPALPKIKCQYKNGVPAGISYRGEKHACYASPDGVSICGALGFHLYEVEELETCYKCCPVFTTTESKSIGSPKPTTTAGTGNGKQDKTWIYITLAVVVAIVAVVLGLLYKKGCFNASRDEGIGNPGEDLPLPIQISDDIADALEMNQEEVVETPPPWVTEKTNTYTKVGCFNDKDSPLRALPVLVENFRLSNIDWTDMNKTVQKCADAVKDRGYKWFAVQFYGECWSGPEASLTYNKYGPSKNCWKGVGKHWTNMVYKLKEEGGGNSIN